MGILNDAYQRVAGVGDHLAGDVDESIGRQFDDSPGGGFADLAPEGHDPETDGVGNRFLFGPTRTAYDYVFEYDEQLNGEYDTRDLLGPSVGDVGDFVATDPSETERGWLERLLWSLFNDPKRLAVVVGLGLVLYLVGPLLSVIAAVTDD